jgi:hypothetical protein
LYDDDRYVFLKKDDENLLEITVIICKKKKKKDHFDIFIMAEHIDRNRFINALRYRFECLSKCLDFTQNDINILNLLAPIIFPLLPNIIEKTYKKLYSFDTTQNYFLLRHDGFENFIPNKKCGITLISAQVDDRKDMLNVYLKHVSTQNEWNDTFLQYLSRVGEIHIIKGGSGSMNVDYIRINILLLSFLENASISIIWDTKELDEKTKFNALRAINRFFLIQNDFFTMHYGLSINQKLVSTVPIIDFPKCCSR